MYWRTYMEIKVIPTKYVVSGFEFDTEQEAQDWIDNVKKKKAEQQTNMLKDGYLYVVDLVYGWWHDGDYYTVIGTKEDIQKVIDCEDIHIRAEVRFDSIKEYKPPKDHEGFVFGEDFINMLEQG